MKSLKDIAVKGMLNADGFIDFNAKLRDLDLTQSGVIRDLVSEWTYQTEEEIEVFLEMQRHMNVRFSNPNIKFAALKFECPKVGHKLPQASRGRNKYCPRL